MHWCYKYNFWKNSLSPFRGHWGQEVIFEVDEAKFWISSSFHRFSFKNFHLFGFQGCLTSATSATLEGLAGRISNYGDSRPLWSLVWTLTFYSNPNHHTVHCLLGGSDSTSWIQLSLINLEFLVWFSTVHCGVKGASLGLWIIRKRHWILCPKLTKSHESSFHWHLHFLTDAIGSTIWKLAPE